MSSKTHVTVWGEFRHEKKNPKVAAIYPDGMHETIAGFLRKDEDLDVSTAWLDQPDHGLGGDILDKTDVLVWWGHMAHEEVSDTVVAEVRRRVLEGMGLIVLHSGHHSKIFKTLMGTTCSLKWRAENDKERIWNIAPHHPITQGIGDYFEIPVEEMYGEPFGIPTPDELIFISYFRPGHETHPAYHQAEVQRVITNGVCWARATVRIPDVCPKSPALEPLPAAVTLQKP